MVQYWANNWKIELIRFVIEFLMMAIIVVVGVRWFPESLSTSELRRDNAVLYDSLQKIEKNLGVPQR
jgi:hypothetical protein